jgi:hypothetical protein
MPAFLSCGLAGAFLIAIAGDLLCHEGAEG